MRTVKQPLRNEVLVRVVKQRRSIGGILFSDKTRDNNSQGVVILLGPRCTSGLKRGDVVMLPEERKFKLTIDGTQYKFYDEDTILATIEAEAK